MIRLLGMGLALGALAAGCSVPFEDAASVLENTCSDDDSCAEGVCASVEGRARCVATSADLAGVLFQVEGSTSDGRRISHVFAEGLSLQGARPDGMVVGFDLEVPPAVTFGARVVSPAASLAPGCSGVDGSLPIKIELRTSRAIIGLEQVFVAQSEANVTEDGMVHRARLEVPRGVYDVYLAPQPLQPECQSVSVPPRVYRDVEVAADVEFLPEAELPRRLRGFILPREGQTLDGYRLELVDPKRGLVVSAPTVLRSPAPGAPVPLYGGLEQSDVEGVAYYYTDGLVLRLADPEGQLVIHWSFAALDLDGDDVVEVDLGGLIANPRTFRATVVDAQTRPVAAASVTIKSSSLTGAVSENASFRRSAETNAQGIVEVDLVPGIYQVLVAPTSVDSPALLEDRWEIGEDSLCCGKTFELSQRSLLTGAVATADTALIEGVAVVASPALFATRPYFANALESLDLVPRQTATTTDGAGAFVMPVDRGTFDVTVRVPASSGYPWTVVPSILVGPLEQSSATPLGTLTLPSPAVLVGRASALGKPASGAVIRALLPLAPEGETESPTRAVQIAEALADSSGNFVLSLPPTVRLRASPEPATSSSSGGS